MRQVLTQETCDIGPINHIRRAIQSLFVSYGGPTWSDVTNEPCTTVDDGGRWKMMSRATQGSRWVILGMCIDTA